MILLSSWDDGHPADLRVAELMDKNGLNGTFFVPIRNCEGLPVLSSGALRELGQRFEIGGHTIDHVYLNQVTEAEVNRQVSEGKRGLEEILGSNVNGFCYPGGCVTSSVIASVRRAGFTYGRTIENLRFDTMDDPFKMPTTMQFYPHTKFTYISNYCRYGHYVRRFAAMKIAVKSSDYLCRLRELALECARCDGVFHFWGHSWEIEELSAWYNLDEFLAFVSSLGAKSLTLQGYFDHVYKGDKSISQHGSQFSSMCK